MLNRVRSVQSVMNYTGAMNERARFYAVDHLRDNLVLEPTTLEIEDARRAAEAPSLSREGIQLVPHTSAVSAGGRVCQPGAVAKIRSPSRLATTSKTLMSGSPNRDFAPPKMSEARKSSSAVRLWKT